MSRAGGVLAAGGAALLIYLSAFCRSITGLYTHHSDADAIYVGQALALNAGQKLTYFDHTGYLLHLLLSAWLRLADLLGFIDGAEIGGLATAPNFTDFFAPTVIAGRYFSLATGLLFLAVVGMLVRFLTTNNLLAGLAVLLLSPTAGLVFSAFEIRPELLSSLLFLLALYCTLRAQSLSRYYFAWPIAMGVFVYLALLTKVQTIPSVMALSVIAVVRGRRWHQPDLERALLPASLNVFERERFGRQHLLSVLLLAVIWSLSPWFHLSHLVDNFRAYHLVCVAWLVASVVVYKLAYVSSWRSVGVWLVLFIMGLSIGFLPYFVHTNHRNIFAIVSFVEHTSRFIIDPEQFDPVRVAITGARATLARYYDVALFLQAPQVTMGVLSLVLAAFLLWKREIRACLLPLAIIGLALCLETYFALRTITVTYYVYTDCLHVIALSCLLALAIRRLPSTRARRWALAASATAGALLTVQTATSTADLLRRGSAIQPVANLCVQATYTKNLYADLMRRAGSKEACPSFVERDIAASRYTERWGKQPK